MNPRTKKKMDKINQRLEEYQQKTRLVELSASSLILNTGQEFYNNDASKFIKRVMNNKVIEWVKNIDELLAGNISENKIKHVSFSIGGKACQEKHGEKIKYNLNTGLPWNKGTKGQNFGSRGPLPDEVKAKISLKNKGPRNGRYGYKYTDQEKLNKSATMQKIILEGDFTPKLNNRRTHWESKLDGISFRSSWEALYQYINANAIYEELRLKYTYENKSKIYIVDFIDHVNKLVVEVKPKELCVGSKFFAKMQSLNDWAKQHLYTVQLIDQYWLKKQTIDVDYTRFDKNTAYKIRKLYEINKTD